MHYLDNLIFSSLSATNILYLSQPFTPSEIKIVVRKAPRPDGIPTEFYQESWDLVGHHITQTALSFLSGHTTIEQLNYTNLVLITKTKHPQIPADFRPIGLCNTMYKIISKVIVARISTILPNIIEKIKGLP